LDVSTARATEIQREFAGNDLVFSAIPASFSPLLAPLAVEAGAHFCDLGGVPAVSAELRSADIRKAARGAGRVILEGAGLEPGLGGSMMSALNGNLGGEADELIDYVGGLGQFPKEESYFWQRTFSAKGLVEILGPVTILQDHKLVEVEPCSGGTTMTLPELQERFPTQFNGVVESRITAGAGVSPEVMARLGVRNCREETLRWNWPLFLEAIQRVPSEHRVQWVEDTLPHTGPEQPDIVVSIVFARKGLRNILYALLEGYDHKRGLSAMAKTTGYSAAAAALLIARGGIPAGVLSPEELDWRTNAQLIANLSRDLNICFRG
jgi:lysine 6-dehydrogenase